ncbi:MAG: hypothetical protein COX48_05800 [bacterium (Candidatus Stahlbacteria) CG23_combo_of_CG06-09_8_20_14_all_34_7]|nr:MAG: hypothetical protein COX48_05800 [bacterium (Candidatus Stahlbacteria) CG23_combo_of_CG06-09_8_20_14_all_34_7]
MAVIKPFKGIRPVKEKAREVCAPPYDTLSVKEAREMVKKNKYSFLHVEKSEIDCPDSYDVHDQRIFDKGRKNLEKLLKEKIMFQDKEECLYIYKQIMGKHEQTGIVTVASVEDYINDVIKKHENTREDKEIERAMHIDTINANTGSVFLTYRKRADVNEIVKKTMRDLKPEYDFIDKLNVRHIFYVVKDKKTIDIIVKIFAGIENLYVADGHHRSAAATRIALKRRKEEKSTSKTEEYNYFLSVIFPDDEMMIMDYNRVVKDLNRMTKDKFIKELEKKFVIEKIKRMQKPVKIHDFTMYIEDESYIIKAKDEIINRCDFIKSLDVSILQENVLGPLLNIENPRTDKRIDFIGGIRGIKELKKLVDSKEYRVAFALFPTSMEQLMNVSDSGKVMPPKSTWFEPKLQSGIVIHKLS